MTTHEENSHKTKITLDLFPAIEPYATESLKVSSLHTIVYEQVGNPTGRPALFLHGGPGVGIYPEYRRFFDPDYYRIILVDQRGAGRSTPHAVLEENTTWDIVSDLEQLKRHLGINDWVVMGGSWGSLLALCYAIKHPESVAGIIIRGIFLGRKKELDWLYKPGGASAIYPDEWMRYQAPLGDSTDTIDAYRRLLNDPDPDIAFSSARSWARWEAVLMTLLPDEQVVSKMLLDKSALSIARCESHYAANQYFLENDNYVLDNCHVIEHIPLHIIQGRCDVICPPQSAWELHQALPNSNLRIVPNGAHSPLDSGMVQKLIASTELFRTSDI